MTPEQRIQHEIMRAAMARGYEVVRLNLFQPGGSITLTTVIVAWLNAICTGPAAGLRWAVGTWVLHVPLPEPSRGVPDLMLVRPDLPPMLVEVKTDTGRLSPEQRGWHARYGKCSVVCRSVADATVAMNAWEAMYGSTTG